MTSTASGDLPLVRRFPLGAQVVLSQIAAGVFAYRAIRTADLGDQWAGFFLVSLAALFALAAAVTAFRSPRWAALPLAGALFLELFVLDQFFGVAPPRLINAIPLLFALALAAVPGPLGGLAQPTRASQPLSVATVISLVAMVPIGLLYLLTGLVAPAPDLFAAYVLFALLLGVAVWLARQRSWWVIAVPIVSAGLWPLMVWMGETFLDWSA